MDQVILFERLGVALGVGILVGLERGWSARERAEGSRVAGIRTFAITGLLGGLWALLADWVGEIVLGFAFVAFALVIIIARVRVARETHDYGATTVVAALVTFALGAVAARGQLAIAAAGGVVTALLLGIKPTLHHWVERIEQEELLAVLKLLVMTLVLLPVLPDQGYGPWQALNPYELWWMVVLIAGTHFLGYIAVRLAGERRGIPMAGLAGGLVASTAVAISFSRLGRTDPGAARLYAAGIVLASAVMCARMLVVVALVGPTLLVDLAWLLVPAALAMLLAAAILWRGQASERTPGELASPRNPFELGMALKFGVLLAVVMLLARGLKAWLGDSGAYLLGLVSGIADVDAVTLSLARLAGADLAPAAAAGGIALAALMNTMVKGGIAAYAGGRGMALPVALAFGAAILAGGAGYAAAVLLSGLTSTGA